MTTATDYADADRAIEQLLGAYDVSSAFHTAMYAFVHGLLDAERAKAFDASLNVAAALAQAEAERDEAVMILRNGRWLYSGADEFLAKHDAKAKETL